MRKPILLVIIGITFLIATSCAGNRIDTSAQSKAPVEAVSEEKTEAEGELEIIPVLRNSVNTVGQVSATAVKSIILDFPATIEKVNVRDGQRVKYGDSLIVLDLKEFEAQIKSMELDLRSGKEEISMIKNTYFTTNSNPELQRLMNDLKNAQNLYDKNKKELADNQKLYEAGSLSKNELDQFKETVNESKMEVDNIKLSIDSLKMSRQAEVDLRVIEVTKLEADLKLMKEKLNKPYIRKNEIISDIKNGAVIDIGYAAGDVINNTERVLSFLDLDSLIVKAEIPEKYIKDVKVGAEAAITLRADSSRKYMGKVIRISSVPVSRDGEAYTPIEVSIDNKDDSLLPNYFVNVKINIEEKK